MKEVIDIYKMKECSERLMKAITADDDYFIKQNLITEALIDFANVIITKMDRKTHGKIKRILKEHKMIDYPWSNYKDE